MELDRDTGDLKVRMVRAEFGWYVYVQGFEGEDFTLNTDSEEVAWDMFKHPYCYKPTKEQLERKSWEVVAA